jgi:hypothetical protein
MKTIKKINMEKQQEEESKPEPKILPPGRFEAKFLGELRTMIREFLEENPDKKVSSPKFIDGIWEADAIKD